MLLLLACNDDYAVNAAVPDDDGLSTAPVIEVDPPLLEFGALAVGEVATLSVAVSNVGATTLEIEHLGVTGTTAFTVVETDTTAELAPGASATFTVAFSPVNQEDVGTLEVISNDPLRRTATVPLGGLALAPELLVYPNPLSFGPVPILCQLTMPIHLENTGLADLEISALAEDVPEVALADLALPLILAPGEELTFDATFAPVAVGEEAGGLYVTSNDLVSVRGVAISGEGVVDGSYTEDFYQGDGPFERTDLLLYVDGSCSMEDDQSNLATNFDLFAEALEAVSLDWQLAVVTEDSGCHNGDYFTADNLDVDDLLAAVRGPVGTWTEAGLTITQNALGELGGCNEDFLRPDSKSTVILVSDEPEQSRDTPEEAVANIRSVAPNTTIHAIAGDIPRGCRTAEPGVGYNEAALLTGGVFLSVCDPDWGAYFAAIAERAASGQTGTFPLEGWPDPDSLVVAVDGAVRLDWTYVSTTNAIEFADGGWPPANSRVSVTYRLDADCDF